MQDLLTWDILCFFFLDSRHASFAGFPHLDQALPPLGALRGERNDDASQMDSQMLLGSVMDSLRSKETSRNGGVAVPPPPSLLEEEEEEEEGEEVRLPSRSAWSVKTRRAPFRHCRDA